jgi:hypothetical protein
MGESRSTIRNSGPFEFGGKTRIERRFEELEEVGEECCGFFTGRPESLISPSSYQI